MLYGTGRTLKLAVAVVDGIFMTAVLWVLAWLPTKVRDPIYPALYQYWSGCFVRIMGVDLHVHHKNRLALPEHYLLVANHPSSFEDAGIPHSFPVRAIAKKELTAVPILGRIGQAAGTVFVSREDKESRKQAAKAAVDFLKTGNNLVVFPEGGCYPRLREFFHQGTFQLAIDAGVKILPVYIEYEALNDFAWGDESMPQNMYKIFNAPSSIAHFHVYDAIDPNDFDGKESLTEHVHKQFQQWEDQYLA
jgi:1-acyl-sn-glycerol-3-phosphate acyltransferase